MHFSNLLALASAVTVAYGYGVATVKVSYHDSCSNNRYPQNSVGDSELVVATQGTCTSAPPKHSFEVDAYSFKVDGVTNDTPSKCRALAVYADKDCTGLPQTIVPFYRGQTDVQSPCISDEKFDDGIYFRLICEDDHEDEHGGPEHDASEHEQNSSNQRQGGHARFLKSLGA